MEIDKLIIKFNKLNHVIGKYFLNFRTGSRELCLSIKFLPYKHKDLRSDPHHPGKKLGTGAWLRRQTEVVLELTGQPASSNQ